MYIIKRNGTEVQFDVEKIRTAIAKANAATIETARITNAAVDYVTSEVEEYANSSTAALSVEDVSDRIETFLMKVGPEVAKNFINYRYTRALIRKANSTDEQILSLLERNNEETLQENSNKNPIINSTQRDYMAGEVSKDLTNRLLLPQDIVEAHKSGIIHFHDSDYFAQHMHNCFTGGTKLVTSQGTLPFNSFQDGEAVYIRAMDGKMRVATIHKYGKQKMNVVKMHSGKVKQTFYCTANHRWILANGSVTTALKVGDKLYKTLEAKNNKISNKEEALAFCLGFIIGDGTDRANGSVSVRLCKDKARFADIFKMAGFTEQHTRSNDPVMYISKLGAFKQDFLNAKGWRFVSSALKPLIFEGYYAADGSTCSNRISTSDERVERMIEDLADFAGYYITSKKELYHDTNYKKNARLVNYHFYKKIQANNFAWTVDSIESYRHGEVDAWCVEEPVTHSFTLEKGVITGNCCLVNLEDMLQNGTVISEVAITKPHSLRTAANIATQAVAQVASSQYGGQTISLAHLAPFVDISRQHYIKEVDAELQGIQATQEQKDAIVQTRLRKEIKDAVQTIQYQLITLMTTNGQTPFVSVNMDISEAKEGQEREDLILLIEEVLRQRIKGVPNNKGVFVTPAFPKLLYVLDDDNDHEGSKYWNTTVLAAQCTAKRMVPDYISAKKMKEYKMGDHYPCMGCRSFLTNDNENLDEGLCNAGNKAGALNYVEGQHKYYGRFNQGVVTINLVDVACSSGKDLKKFWEIFEERSELVHKALRLRHERLLGTPSDVAPILWQHGALARLKKGEVIDKLLYGNYSTISYGYAGLYECVYYMTGHSHTDPEAKDFALKVMQFMNDKCKEWRKAENISYSVYGTPIESTTYKFAKALQKRFGIIPEVTDHDYITNSYHVNVREKIDSFTKLRFEADFQRLSPGGAISYVELPDMTNNVDAILAHITFISNNIMYAEMNIKSDYCQCCGYDGEIKIVHDDNDKLIWECPNCGNRDQRKMNVARRTCGYIGSNFWNQGRTQEIDERVVHISVPVRDISADLKASAI